MINKLQLINRLINFAALMKEDKKESILDTAEKLFSEHGYDGTSTRTIAHEAGVNMAMLNYYFGSKEGLYRSIFERKFKGFRQILIDLNEEDIPSWNKLHRYIDLYVERITNQSCFQRLMQHEISLQQRSETSGFIRQNLLMNINELRRIIREGIENGSFREVDIDLTVATIFGTKYYISHLSNISSDLLGKDLNDPKIIEEDIKPRLKKHLVALLDAHLAPARPEQ